MSGPVRRPALVAVALATAVAGPLSERAGGPVTADVWLPDLAVGWSLVACGVVATDRRRASRSGLLLMASGLLWFLPNFTEVQVAWVAWLAGHTVYLHRGPLIHALIGHPTGRSSSRLARGATALGYLAAFTTVWERDGLAVALALLLLLLVVVDQRRARGPTRRARTAGVQATVFLMLVLAGTALLRIVAPGTATSTVTRWLVEVSFCAVAAWLLWALLAERWQQSSVADLVVELGTVRSDRLRDDLARTLADPALQIGYRAPDMGGVDASGRPLELPLAGSGRAVTEVTGPDGPLAVLVHDPAVLDDDRLLTDVRAAATLAAANVQLHAEVQEIVAELARSRRRLLDAADTERGQLEQSLHHGVLSRLAATADDLRDARAHASGPQTRARLGPAQAELEATVADLLRWAHGLHPRELDDLGLEGAVRALAGRAPLPVSVQVSLVGPPPGAAITACAYYTCSEALANCVKHASATTVAIRIGSADGQLTVEVSDDGVGGADTGGSGLRGLADRVETLGGSLAVTGASPSGTRVVARVPLDRPSGY